MLYIYIYTLTHTHIWFILPFLWCCYHTSYISVHGMPTPTDLSLLLYAVIVFFLAALVSVAPLGIFVKSCGSFRCRACTL